MRTTMLAGILLASLVPGLAWAQDPAPPRKTRVLCMDGRPRWEYRCLRNTLLHDPDLSVQCWLQSADADFAQEASDGVPSLTEFPVQREALFAYDVILVGDVDLIALVAAEDVQPVLEALCAFVTEGGGGVGFIAGPVDDPSSYPNSPLGNVLPVIVKGAEPSPKGDSAPTSRPRLTEEGRKDPLTRLVDDAEANRQLWEEGLPELTWHARMHSVKPHGRVLAEWPAGEGKDGPADPLLVVGACGAGRTLFLATDETWRWRRDAGDKYYGRFWRRVIDYLAQGKKEGPK